MTIVFFHSKPRIYYSLSCTTFVWFLADTTFLSREKQHLTKKKIMVSCLEWNKVRPQARTKKVCPPWRLLECWNTCCKTWQVWISRIRQKKFHAFVIYSVPSFQVNAVNHYKEEKNTIRRITWHKQGYTKLNNCNQFQKATNSLLHGGAALPNVLFRLTNPRSLTN